VNADGKVTTMDRQICHAHCPKGGSLWPVAVIIAAVAVIPPALGATVLAALGIMLITVASILTLAAAGAVAWLIVAVRRELLQVRRPVPLSHAARPVIGSSLRRNVIRGDYEVKVIER
jgi:hypothetical protein